MDIIMVTKHFFVALKWKHCIILLQKSLYLFKKMNKFIGNVAI